MGNHFRTSGDEQSASQAPMPQANGVESKDSVPDFQSDPLAQHAASAGDASAAQSAANPMLNIPSPAAPAQPRVNVPDPSVDPVGPSTPSLAGIPDPSAPAAAPAATAAAVTAPDVFMTSAGSAGPSTDADEARQIRDLDAALQNPDFTSVFAPADLDRAQERKKMARQAGVEPVILTEHLTKIYPAQPNKPALDDVNIEIYPGEFVFLVGHSGSGKTTLLNCISTIDTVSAGSILLEGRDITQLKPKELARFRRENLGFIFQDFNLLDTLTVGENIALALTINKVPPGQIDGQVQQMADALNIGDILSKFPYQISGGQKQRCACARAMINHPKLILADEPTGALDSHASQMLLGTLERMNQQMGATIVMVTHDAFTASYTERILFLRDGAVFSELRRGNDSRKQFFEKILDVLTMMGGGTVDVR